MSMFNQPKPTIIVESRGVPIVKETTTVSPQIITGPVEKTVYSSSTYSYTPTTQPKVLSHNEYKYNSNYTSTSAKTFTPKTGEYIKNFEPGNAFFYESVPVVSNTNNIFEITPPHDELLKINYNPRSEIYSTTNFAILMFDLPGVAKENLIVELEQGILKISGKKEKPQVEELEGEHEFHTKIVERPNSYYFYKVFQIPPAFSDGHNISCKLNNGELIIKIMANETKIQKKVINIDS